MFLVTLGAITPAMLIYGAVKLQRNPLAGLAYGDALAAIVRFEWCVALLVSAACWLAAARMWLVRRRSSVRLAMIVLWTLPLMTIFVDPAGVALLSGESVGALISAAGIGLLRPLLYAAFWTAYLTSSVRVANSYPAAAATI